MVVLYIHGFNSSPASLKARQTEEWLKAQRWLVPFECPALNSEPDVAVAQLEQVIAAYNEPIGLIGSSMGGYYATWLSEKYNLKSVLINPAVHPYDLMMAYLGENTNYHTGERYILERRHVDLIRTLDVQQIKNPNNIWVLLQTGDEVLDYRQAEAKYAECTLTVESGGDHSFQRYEQHLSAIINFLQL